MSEFDYSAYSPQLKVRNWVKVSGCAVDWILADEAPELAMGTAVGETSISMLPDIFAALRDFKESSVSVVVFAKETNMELARKVAEYTVTTIDFDLITEIAKAMRANVHLDCEQESDTV